MNARRLINRETVSYLFWGILTSILNVGVFELLLWARTDYRIANLIALIVTKLVAYVVNKLFVFRSHTGSARALAWEFFRYLVTRGGTMLVDWFGLILLVSAFHFPKTPGKIVMTAIVVLLNYIFGKWCVFNKTAANETEGPCAG